MQMNKPVEYDFSFEYIQQLCQAIEDLTQSRELKQPNAFSYRGANLKYAFERALYFLAFNNERLRLFFSQWRQDQLPEVIDFNTEIERDLAFYLCQSSIEPKRLRVKFKNIIRLYKLQKNRLYRLWLKLKTGKFFQNQDVAVISIDHPKFTRFLEPITDNLTISCLYLLQPKLGLKPFFVDKKLPFVDITSPKKFLVKEELTDVFLDFQYIIDLYDYYYATLKELKPQSVIVIEGNHIQDEIINQVGKQLSIPVICLQQGWSPVIHNGFRNMSYTKMLVWGQGFADLLQPYNPEQQFVVTGSHIINSGQQTILSQNLSNQGISFFFQSPKPTEFGTQESWRQLMALVTWTAKEFSEVPVLVREHPQYPFSNEEKSALSKSNIKLVAPSDYSLAAVLNASFLIVAIYSTTILEGIAAGVLPLVFNTTSLPAYFPDIHAAGAGIEVKSLEAAKQTIRRLVTDQKYRGSFQPKLKEFQHRYFQASGSEAVSRIVEEIALNNH